MKNKILTHLYVQMEYIRHKGKERGCVDMHVDRKSQISQFKTDGSPVDTVEFTLGSSKTFK